MAVLYFLVVVVVGDGGGGGSSIPETKWLKRLRIYNSRQSLQGAQAVFEITRPDVYKPVLVK